MYKHKVKMYKVFSLNRKPCDSPHLFLFLHSLDVLMKPQAVPRYYLTRAPDPFGNKNTAIIIKESQFKDSRPGVKDSTSTKPNSRMSCALPGEEHGWTREWMVRARQEADYRWAQLVLAEQ